ncbi:MAG: NAD(P)-dependent oxidoreductase [Terriglobales bacterium]
MIKVAFFELEAWEKEYFAQSLPGLTLVFAEASPVHNPPPEAVDSEIISVFVGSELNRSALEKFPRLRFVCTRSTGYDHVDLEECRRRKIGVCNVPTYGARTVAEFTIALLLALSRKLHRSIERVRVEGTFSAHGLRGFDLRGKTLGVVGTGHIGREVVSIARGFEMRLLMYDVAPDAAFAASMGAAYTSLDDLLVRSDVVTLHVPHLAATHHLMNRDRLFRMKPGALLINTARGGLVDTAALIEALHTGRLGGAALDVLEEEGAIREDRELLLYGHPGESQLRAMLNRHMLIRTDNVIVTPHNAFNTQEALDEIVRITAENIRACLKGTPQNVVS